MKLVISWRLAGQYLRRPILAMARLVVMVVAAVVVVVRLVWVRLDNVVVGVDQLCCLVRLLLLAWCTSLSYDSAARRLLRVMIVDVHLVGELQFV